MAEGAALLVGPDAALLIAPDEALLIGGPVGERLPMFVVDRGQFDPTIGTAGRLCPAVEKDGTLRPTVDIRGEAR